MTKLIDVTLDEILPVARGCYQRNLLRGMESWSGSTLRGKAKDYANRYRDSRSSLLSRLRSAGYVVAEARAAHGRRVVVIARALDAATLLTTHEAVRS